MKRSLCFLLISVVTFGARGEVETTTSYDGQDNEGKSETTEGPWKRLEHENIAEIEDLNDVDKWEPTADLDKSFPYYLSGYDNEGRPVWVAEFGKFRISPLFQKGPRKIEEFEKYIKKAVIRIYKSMSVHNKNQTEIIGLIDFDELPISLFGQIPTLRLLTKIARDYRSLMEDHVYRAFVINVSFPAQTLINFARPLLGRTFEKIEVYGTNKNKWQHVLLEAIPKDQIPKWYGGDKGHVPIEVYG